MAPWTTAAELTHDVAQFLYHEADLLDERRFDEWLPLLADDLRYHVPMRKNLPFAQRAHDITGDDDVSWFDDDKPTIVKRVRQIMTGIHWAEEPLSRVSHLVSNVRVFNGAAVLGGAAEAEVGCRILVHRSRLDDETETLIGRRRDVLRRDGDGWLVARRTVVLDQATLLSKNLTIFL